MGMAAANTLSNPSRPYLPPELFWWVGGGQGFVLVSKKGSRWLEAASDLNGWDMRLSRNWGAGNPKDTKGYAQATHTHTYWQVVVPIRWLSGEIPIN